MVKKAIPKKIENAIKDYARHLDDEGLPIKNIYMDIMRKERLDVGAILMFVLFLRSLIK
ncbi:MAG: hypothetical protein ABIC82_02535 [bacterium]